MRQIKVHSPVQDRIGGTEASDVISISKYFQTRITENVNFIYFLACQFYDMFVLGPKHSLNT
jgi:hypothetical protein